MKDFVQDWSMKDFTNITVTLDMCIKTNKFTIHVCMY